MMMIRLLRDYIRTALQPHQGLDDGAAKIKPAAHDLDDKIHLICLIG